MRLYHGADAQISVTVAWLLAHHSVSLIEKIELKLIASVRI